MSILTYSVLLMSLIGCHPDKKQDPIWHDLKIGDLTPPKKHQQNFFLTTMNFDVYTFEIPAENIDVLNQIWSQLYTEQIQFNNPTTFNTNSFSAAFGELAMWDQIADLLRLANGRKTHKLTLLLSHDQPEDIVIARLDTPQNVFYISPNHSMEGATIGPGQISLRVKANRVPDSRGVCMLHAKPVFSPYLARSSFKSDSNKKTGELAFIPFGFAVRMSPGYFVFLGPNQRIETEGSLASFFFIKPGKKPAIKTYLLFCTGIMD